MKELTYATVCSGIECMSAAVTPLGGWRPVFFSEIEPFPCSLLAHRYPTVPNLGDMTKITAEMVGDEKWRITNGTDVIELAGRLDVLAGGTPCQDVSVAGKRKGMAEGSGTRSSLAFHFARLCRELQPRWVLWENVPGVLTSNGGRDFAHFVRSIGECGYSLAYRTLDAQYVRVDGLPRAVPQRRRRVWLVGMRTVGHTGDGWRAPAEILFEPQGVRGDTAPRRVTGQGFTRPPQGGSAGADRAVPTNANGGDVMPTLNATDLTKRLTGQADRSGVFVMQPSGFDPYEPGGVKTASPEVSGALVNGSSPGYHNAVCFENHQTDARTVQVDVAPTMGATHNAQAANNNPLVVVPADAVVAIDMDKNKPTNADRPVRKGGAGFGVSEKGASYTLTARDQHAVAYAIDSMGSNAMKSKNPRSGCREVECAPTLTTVDSAPVKHQGGTAVVEEVVGVFDMGARKTGAGTDTSGASPTILAAHGTDPHAVAIGLDRASFNQGRNAQFGFTVEEECAPTVVAKGPGAVSFEPGIARREGALHRFMSELASTLRSDMGDNLLAVAIDYIVRRLTPLECERLQGLPDGYTKIPYRGKAAEDCPDTPRYKALGNGWAVNCARWICQRIQNYDRKHTEEN